MGVRPLGRTIEEVHRRLRFAAWLGEWARHGAVALAVAAVLALLGRRFLEWPAGTALLLAGLVLPAGATAWWSVRRRVPSAASVATWLDLRLGGGGRCVTAFELGGRGAALADFDVPGPDAAPLALRMRMVPLARPLLPALAFLALVLWLPIPAGGFIPALATLHAAELERLAEKLATLEETVQLDEALRAELHDRLARAKEQIDDASLASTFEARDQIEARLEQEAAAAQQAIESARAALASDALARALDADAARATEIVAETLADLAQAGLDANLPAGLLDALLQAGLERGAAPGYDLPHGATIDPELLARLATQLDGALGARLAQLIEAGLIDPAQLEPFDGELVDHECDPDCEEGGG